MQNDAVALILLEVRELKQIVSQHSGQPSKWPLCGPIRQAFPRNFSYKYSYLWLHPCRMADQNKLLTQSAPGLEQPIAYHLYVDDSHDNHCGTRDKAFELSIDRCETTRDPYLFEFNLYSRDADGTLTPRLLSIVISNPRDAQPGIVASVYNLVNDDCQDLNVMAIRSPNTQNSLFFVSGGTENKMLRWINQEEENEEKEGVEGKYDLGLSEGGIPPYHGEEEGCNTERWYTMQVKVKVEDGEPAGAVKQQQQQQQQQQDTSRKRYSTEPDVEHLAKRLKLGLKLKRCLDDDDAEPAEACVKKEQQPQQQQKLQQQQQDTSRKRYSTEPDGGHLAKRLKLGALPPHPVATNCSTYMPSTTLSQAFGEVITSSETQVTDPPRALKSFSDGDLWEELDERRGFRQEHWGIATNQTSLFFLLWQHARSTPEGNLQCMSCFETFDGAEPFMSHTYGSPSCVNHEPP